MTENTIEVFAIGSNVMIANGIEAMIIGIQISEPNSIRSLRVVGWLNPDDRVATGKRSRNGHAHSVTNRISGRLKSDSRSA